MKLVPTLASVVFLLWACSAVLKVPPRQFSWAIPAYVIAQMFFGLIGWMALQKWTEEWEGFHSNYQYLYFALFLINCLLASIIAMRFLALHAFGVSVFIIVGAVGISAAAIAAVYEQLWQMFDSVPPDTTFFVIIAAILSTCGLTTLLSLGSPMTPALRICALSLAIFWLGMSLYFFLYVLGIQMNLDKWARLNLWLVPVLVIVCFGGMAKRLAGLQAESAPQAVTSDRMQTQVAQ